MTQLTIFKGQRLARPVGVDWFRQIQKNKLLNLKVGTHVWSIEDDWIECSEVSAPSARLDTTIKPKLHGVQVFYGTNQKIFCPRLIMDGEPSGLYIIVDREAAFEYYAKHTEESERRDIKLQVVGGSG